ncbi:MAG: phosphoenolpyruvate carboxylase [Patescibacteria group bacterium]
MRNQKSIPKIMFTQHPDNACIPYWYDSAFIKTHREPKECYQLFSDFGNHELMWDWEGKLVDESVLERLLGKYGDFFSKHQIGKDVFITFRIPNPKVESGFRLGKAFMTMLSSENIAKKAGLHTPPMFEVILPLTENAEDLYRIHKLFADLSHTMKHSFRESYSFKEIDLIPLFESVETIMKSGNILKEYVKILKKETGRNLKYLRPFVARSDPSLNSGIVATTVSIKWALSEFAKFSSLSDIPTYPIIGPGALPFRGGLRPDRVGEFLDEYSGVKTVLIQSSFRYDYEFIDVKNAIEELVKEIPKHHTQILMKSDYKKIQYLIEIFEKPYKEVVEEIAPLIQKIAKSIPQRRERVQHIGLFGYSRSLGKTKLPRAIGFTACCYSIGIPPEFFGIGEGLEILAKTQDLDMVFDYYINLKRDLELAGCYLRKESLKELSFKKLAKNIEKIENILDVEFGPKNKDEKQHAKIVEQILVKFKKGEDVTEEIEQAAILRKSLG